jgi:hypothetical protein
MTTYIVIAAPVLFLAALYLSHVYATGLDKMRREFAARFPGRCFECSRRRFFLEAVVVHEGCLEVGE